MKKSILLARMMQFGDSMLPVGAFAFSSGLESAVQKGIVHNVATLQEYTLANLAIAAKGDAVAVVWATRAAVAGDLDALVHIDHEVLCRKLGEETRNMTTRMGKKLAEMGADITESPLVAAWRDLIKQRATPGTYPVSLAVQFAAMGLSSREEGGNDTSVNDTSVNDTRATGTCDFDAVLAVHFYGVAMTLLNASMRLMRISHIDMQQVLYHVVGHFDALSADAAQTPLDQMSGYAPMVDILAANHVQAHVRMFMG